LITGVMLIGTTGLMFVVGWAIWALALAVLLSAAPTTRDKMPRRRRASYPAPTRRVVSTRIHRGWPVVKSIRIRRPSEWTN
jgi:hypothetical protein